MQTSPTGTPVIPPQYVPILVATLMAINAALVALQQNLPNPTAKLVCAVLLATLGPILATLSPGLRKKDGPGTELGEKLGGSGAVKGLLLALAVGAALLVPSTSRAQGFDWSVGPTLPFLAYELGGSTTPVQVAPGAGLQVSVTHDALKVDLGGKAWDAVDLTGMAFGTLVTPASGQQFGELSAAVAVGFLSNLVSVGVGKHLLAPDSALVHGGYFVVLALNFNLAVAPTAPSGNATFDKASWHVPRGNTLYLVGGP